MQLGDEWEARKARRRHMQSHRDFVKAKEFPDGAQEGRPPGKPALSGSHISWQQVISRSPYRPVWRCLPTVPAAQGSCGKGCRSLLSCPHPLPACWARAKGPFHLEASQERAKLTAAGASSTRRLRTDSGFECLFSSGSMQVLVQWSTEVVTCKEVQFFFSLANNEAPTCLSCQVMPNETAAPQVSHPLLGSQDPVHVW